MDPFSNTVGYMTLLDVIPPTMVRIAGFAKSFQDVPSELITIHGHLERLNQILSFRYHDSSSGDASGCAVPDPGDHIKHQINDCLDVLDELGHLTNSYRGSWIGRWVLTGKPAAENIARVLEDCIGRFQLPVSIETR